MKQTIRLTAEDSGTAEAPIVYEAKISGAAVFAAGAPIRGWKPVKEDVARSKLALGPKTGFWTHLLTHRNREWTACCPHCGRSFIAPPSILAAIRAYAPDPRNLLTASGGLNVAPAAWADSRLQGQCPRCQTDLRFTPFFTDDRDQF